MNRILIALTLLTACGPDDPEPVVPFDGSVDAGADAGSDAAADAGSDAGADAGIDGGTALAIAGHWHISRAVLDEYCPYHGESQFEIEIVPGQTGYDVLRGDLPPVPLELDPTDPGRYAFTLHEIWTNDAAQQVTADVRHELELDGDLLRGEATSWFLVDNDTSFCEGFWKVEALPVPCNGCSAGPPPTPANVQVVATGENPWTTKVLGGHLYWASFTTIYRVEDDGSSIEIYGSDDFISQVTEAPSSLVFWNYDGSSGENQILHRLASDGSVIDIAYHGGFHMRGVAATDEGIYVARIEGVDLVHADGSVTPLLQNELDVEAQWVRRFGDEIWVGDSAGAGRIGRISADGASLESVITGAAFAQDFELTGDHAVRGQLGTIERFSIGGGSPLTLAVQERQLSSLAVIGNDVYWLAEFGEETLLRRVSLDGGAAQTIHRGHSMNGLEAHDGTLYWVDSLLASVMSLTP